MRPVRSVPLLVVAMMLATLAPISPAHADTVEATCEGGFHTVKWTPPLTFTTQDHTFSSKGGYGGDFTGACQFGDGTTGTMAFKMGGEVTASCTSGSGKGNITITWDNGEKSIVNPLTVSFAPNPGGTGAALDATGTVNQGGRFEGSTVRASFTQTADPTLCAGDGIAEASGPCPQLTFTRP